MKRNVLAIVLCASLLMSGCVPAINPFYTKADVYFDSKLLGVWMDEDETESWRFEAGNENDYKLTYTDEYKKTGVFTAKLFKLGGRSFLDLTPLRSASGQNDFYIGHMLPLHTFVQITLNGTTGNISHLDPAWLERLLEKDPKSLHHAVFDNDIFLTDTTKNLQAFLIANLNAPEAFVRSTELRRKPIHK